MKTEWESFTSGLEPASPKSDNWITLKTVRHGTHLTPALRIAEDSKISAALIYDGRLKNSRTKVVYFSPNNWNDGSRYGTFEFEAVWANLLSERTLYWVERIDSYTLPICRYILTRGGQAEGLTVYDPVNDDGPLRFVDGTWLRAGSAVMEIVIDEDVLLSEITAYDVTKHHDSYCSFRRPQCEERGPTGMRRASGRFLAGLLGRGIKTLNPLMMVAGAPSSSAEHGLSEIVFALRSGEQFNGPVADDKTAEDVLKAACLFLHNGDREVARRHAKLIDSASRFERVILNLARDHFGVPDWTWY